MHYMPSRISTACCILILVCAVEIVEEGEGERRGQSEAASEREGEGAKGK